MLRVRVEGVTMVVVLAGVVRGVWFMKMRGEGLRFWEKRGGGADEEEEGRGRTTVVVVVSLLLVWPRAVLVAPPLTAACIWCAGFSFVGD